MICELATQWKQEENEVLMAALCIASFEIIVYPPQEQSELHRLFTLARDPKTRWAVFAAYENFPWLLREHAERYSEGAISGIDCDTWLEGQGF